MFFCCKPHFFLEQKKKKSKRKSTTNNINILFIDDDEVLIHDVNAFNTECANKFLLYMLKICFKPPSNAISDTSHSLLLQNNGYTLQSFLPMSVYNIPV